MKTLLLITLSFNLFSNSNILLDDMKAELEALEKIDNGTTHLALPEESSLYEKLEKSETQEIEKKPDSNVVSLFDEYGELPSSESENNQIKKRIR